MNTSKAVIIGATSGIGRELAKIFSQKGFVLGLAGRRQQLLLELQAELPTPTYIKRIDVSRQDDSIRYLKELVAEMGGMEIIVISSGVCFSGRGLDWQMEKKTIDVNVAGFAAMADAAFDFFCGQGAGQIVGISSVRAARGGWSAPAYNASKAFVSNYLEGLRIKAGKMGKDIHMTDIRPGFVDTPMLGGRKSKFLVTPADKAAEQIFSAVKNRKRSAYIPPKWALIAMALKILPYKMYEKL